MNSNERGNTTKGDMMDYIITANNQQVQGKIFRDAASAHACVHTLKEQWSNIGMNPPEYKVYYRGFKSVEVDEQGCAV